MRKILFRGKRLDNKEWVHGHYATKTYTSGCFGFERPTINGHLIDSNTIGQYTGLVDQNGKMIFEGDIVRHGGKNFIVKWINQYARFAGWEEGAIFCSFLLDKSVVIGNIYENPELVEGGMK